MNEKPNQQPIDPELEARIAAWVHGEVTGDEFEQLSRLIEERTELAALKDELQRVDGLLNVIGREEVAAPDGDWKLSPEKRSVVLAAIDQGPSERSSLPFVAKPGSASKPNAPVKYWSFTRIAGAVVAASLLGLMTIGLMMPAVNSARESAHRVAQSDIDMAMEFVESAPAAGPVPMQGGTEMTVANESLLAEPAAVSDSELGKNPRFSDFALGERVSGEADSPSPMFADDFSQFGRTAELPELEELRSSQRKQKAALKRENSWSSLERQKSAAKSDLGTRALTIPGSSGSFGALSKQPAESNEYSFDSKGMESLGRSGGMDSDEDGVWLETDLQESVSGKIASLDQIRPELGYQGIAEGMSWLPHGQSGAGGMDIGAGVEEMDGFDRSGDSIADKYGVASGVSRNALSDLRANRSLDRKDMQRYEVPEEIQLGQALQSDIGSKQRGFFKQQTQVEKSPAKKSTSSVGFDETPTKDEAFSTFSLHVGDVSFKLALAALSRGQWPDPSKVRIEEFVNAFDYGDPMPIQPAKVACRVEQAIHPFVQQRNVMRVSMRTAAAGRASGTPLRLTFLLDNSGSMERMDRQQTVRRAFALLAGQMTPKDQMTLISFARQPRLLADQVSGAQSQQLVDLIDNLPSEGGTNIESALQLAFEKALEQKVDGAQNRIVLLTDGAVNLGDADPGNLSRKILDIRDAGIAFDAAGISAEGLNDEILEALTRQGDGRYYLLDSSESVDEGFASQIAGALRPSAKNVKVQVEFNPKRVGRYKLLGFEKHRLNQEDFRNDQVDAAEMAAAEAGVAVYQFEPIPDGEGDVGSVSVRFRDLTTGEMVENRWPIPYQADVPRPEQSAPAIRIAMSAALLAAKLRGEPIGETVDLKTLSSLVSGLPDQKRQSTRVRQLAQMIEQARQISGQ
jgi:Mg-chelatase subunit ChlD